MRLMEGLCVRNILGEFIAVPTGSAAAKLSGLVALSGSGKLLFDLLQTEQTEQSLLEAMLREYDIDEETALADIREYLDAVRQHGLLIEEDEN